MALASFSGGAVPPARDWVGRRCFWKAALAAASPEAGLGGRQRTASARGQGPNMTSVCSDRLDDVSEALHSIADTVSEALKYLRLRAHRAHNRASPLVRTYGSYRKPNRPGNARRLRYRITLSS